MTYEIGEPIVPKRLRNFTFQTLFLELCNRYSKHKKEHLDEYEDIMKGYSLYKDMITDIDTIWLGIAGIGIVEGQGGFIIDLIEKGFVDVICSTGAQVYHDLHFAYNLPVNMISPHVDDDELKNDGLTRIYDAVIDEKKTLEAQDKLIQDFVIKYSKILTRKPVSSVMFNYYLGDYVLKTAKYPERSFVAACAKNKVPLFWDSMQNHSITLNLAKLYLDGIDVQLDAKKDILLSAAIVYNSEITGFFELGGGGPKNFIQQTSPMISQILGIEFEGADRGLQITTANVEDGGLSGCTFNEGVTWGKYKKCDKEKLLQIKGDYRLLFPLMAHNAYHACKPRSLKHTVSKLVEYYNALVKKYREARTEDSKK